MARIKTGIYGLDQLIEGGVRDNTAIVIVGSSGTGKTTFAMQFLMHGIENGEQGLYVTMEESPEQLMKEAEMLGWDMKKHYEKSLFFIHLKGKNFKKMIDEQIPQLVKARSDYDIKTRVVIDPMTPVIWATEDKLQQREMIGKLFYTLKELGVVVATVEEHSRPGEIIGEDVLLPVYLADGAINLEYYPIGGAFNRTLKIIKMRGTHHGEGVYPYIFAR
ncbi:MAG: ATPase domain-containing protein, partial [Thermoplasmata archaeon]|nr:ATPase domain-containing protein [Thermoplasmata archaeon]